MRQMLAIVLIVLGVLTLVRMARVMGTRAERLGEPGWTLVYGGVAALCLVGAGELLL